MQSPSMSNALSRGETPGSEQLRPLFDAHGQPKKYKKQDEFIQVLLVKAKRDLECPSTQERIVSR